MYQLMSQLAIDQTKAAGKREQLLKLLREVGQRKFVATLEAAVANYQGEFCPTIGIIRN